MLLPAGWVYGEITARRMNKAPSVKVHVPVICIGNLVVGGTGKTPFSIGLAKQLQRAGKRPGFLLRGFGGALKGPVQVNPDHHSAHDVGDEALLLAKVAPTVVCADRGKGALMASAGPIDVLLMDDGFQNPSLHKDLSIVLVDLSTGFGNGECLPAGPLRAPVKKQLQFADILVTVESATRKTAAGEAAMNVLTKANLPVFSTQLVACSDQQEVSGKEYIAFSGIGRPEKFFETLKREGAKVVTSVPYADHHPFTRQDAEKLVNLSALHQTPLMTTEKDFARFETRNEPEFKQLRQMTAVFKVQIEIENLAEFMRVLKKRLFAP
ncbi:tetraacyldisaccharide 4'-kinase [Roseibium hamelinense]|nr:tetraacyldisaccharide 4'-kinase [Roseibium hamelinense]